MTDYPAISGIDDASQTRVILFQSGKLVHAPVLDIGLQPVSSVLTFLATGLVGTVFDYAGATAPGGFLLCFGQSLATATYPALFAVIGYTYGGAGANFNLPDYRGRVGAGQDDMGGTSANRLTSPLNGDTLGASGGAETVTLAITNLPAHDHGGVTGAEAAHTHASTFVLTSGGALSGPVRVSGSGSSAADFSSKAGSSHTHTVASQGSGTPATIVQPTLIINKIIFAGV